MVDERQPVEVELDRTCGPMLTPLCCKVAIIMQSNLHRIFIFHWRDHELPRRASGFRDPSPIGLVGRR
jgi:hypothetical protein